MSSLELDISDISCVQEGQGVVEYGAKKFPPSLFQKNPGKRKGNMGAFKQKNYGRFGSEFMNSFETVLDLITFREAAGVHCHTSGIQDLRLGLVYFAGRDKAGNREHRRKEQRIFSKGNKR